MFKKAKNIFIVGIGGIGTSGLARILRRLGHEVRGSDIADSPITEKLRAEGLRLTVGHSEKNLSNDIDLLIYSAAVPRENPERAQARKSGIRQLSYPEALGNLISGYQVVAVAGTNGKTTTTAMIATILEEAGEDPTVLVGSQILAWGSNARVGKGKFFVLEADEYRRAFLHYPADVAVITNIEPDHLDYFKDLADIQKAFQEFVAHIKPQGALVYNKDASNLKLIVGNSTAKKNSFSAIDAKNVKLKVLGDFNRENAAAARATCQYLGVSEEKILSGLEKFTGTWRRFEKIGSVGRTEIISDYAHHPAAITATLKAVSEVYGGKKVLVVFQPHQHNRTKKLFKEFVQSFCQSQFQDFIISEIFDVTGREESRDQDVSSRDLVVEIKRCGKSTKYARDLAECEQMVRTVMNNYDMIMLMGAGDIYQVANRLLHNSRS